MATHLKHTKATLMTIDDFDLIIRTSWGLKEIVNAIGSLDECVTVSLPSGIVFFFVRVISRLIGNKAVDKNNRTPYNNWTAMLMIRPLPV